jgi:DNA-directed RNA polymerase specialized sigma24 family protein
MSAEDKRQEWERIKLEHPDYRHYQISRRLIDVQRSRAWSDSYAGKVQHISFDDMNICRSPISDDYLDLMIAIGSLNKGQQQAVHLYLQGHSKSEIAKLLKVTQPAINHRMKKAISQMRKALCHPEA